MIERIQIQILGPKGSGKSTFINRINKDFTCPEGEEPIKDIMILVATSNDDKLGINIIEDQVVQKSDGYIILIDPTCPHCEFNIKEQLRKIANVKYREGYIVFCINKIDMVHATVIEGVYNKIKTILGPLLSKKGEIFEINAKTGYQAINPISYITTCYLKNKTVDNATYKMYYEIPHN